MTGAALVVLPAELRSVAAARRMVHAALTEVGADDLFDRAALAVSEIVTNAVVHAGSAPRLMIAAAPGGLRVEVGDGSVHLPAPRDYAPTAGTGRGLRLVEHSVDRWGVDRTPAGKTVWFEIGASPPAGPAAEDRDDRPSEATATVRLLDVPLLMHWAWQEHANALLREYLLYAYGDDPHIVEQHAEASEALSILHEQIPRPRLPDDPEALLADTLEPGVTAPELRIEVPLTAVARFATLDHFLGRAVEAAEDGLLLGPPTQPEIGEMREWLCEEILQQAAGAHVPRPWQPRVDPRATVADGQDLLADYARANGRPGDIIVTDQASIIVAVSASVTGFLGYAHPDELLGRRIIVVVPPRYHQAHIAGTTLNATNGRDVLLGTAITVPVVRADGSEALVELRVEARSLAGKRVFVADMVLPDGA